MDRPQLAKGIRRYRLEHNAALHLGTGSGGSEHVSTSAVRPDDGWSGNISFGTARQRERYLPPILSGDHWWCQGYSEPGAGSDLASLRTRAVRDGDHYIVNGHRTWTTLAQYADWIFCLVRTDPNAKPQEGITFLLIDMRSPGVSVRPIITIDGVHEVNDVFLDDVRVSLENRIGEENRGWDYAKFLLGHERTSMAVTA